MDLHAGGCGIAALALARWIKKSDMRATVLFVLGQNDTGCYTTNASAVLDSTIEPDSASHIGLIVYDFDNNQQHIIDSRGLFDMGNYSFINVFSSESIMVRSINRVNRWNERFSREFVKDIAERLDVDMSDIDCRTPQEYATDQPFRSYKNAVPAKLNDGYASLLWELAQPYSKSMFH